MKARTIALLWMLAAGVMAAQTPPPSQKVVPDSRPRVVRPVAKQASRAAAPAQPAAGVGMQSKPAAPRSKPAAGQSKPAAAAKKAAAKPRKTAGTVVKKAEVRASSDKAPAKRDPFLSPIRESGAVGPACTTGKKCLAISTIVLRGIVKSQSGMIAVVESSTRKISYFLRENDPVFNGYVVKITPDTIVFRENVMDRLGKQSTRDVMMKVVAPAV
ncbi:MAG: hypothetical protein LAN64_10250 [Acidobacteriia bacterium]|nr:hypothetical protein [Terriglobia bacterium]